MPRPTVMKIFQKFTNTSNKIFSTNFFTDFVKSFFPKISDKFQFFLRVVKQITEDFPEICRGKIFVIFAENYFASFFLMFFRYLQS